MRLAKLIDYFLMALMLLPESIRPRGSNTPRGGSTPTSPSENMETAEEALAVMETGAWKAAAEPTKAARAAMVCMVCVWRRAGRWSTAGELAEYTGLLGKLAQ